MFILYIFYPGLLNDQKVYIPAKYAMSYAYIILELLVFLSFYYIFVLSLSLCFGSAS